MKRMLYYIDLFCGAGGTSTGVEAARLHEEKCADMEPQEIDGQHFMVSTQMYIQPKKSELQ